MSNSSVEAQWNAAQVKQTISLNMMPRSASTSTFSSRYPITNISSNNIQPCQQQPAPSASSKKALGSGVSRLEHQMNAAQPCPTASELMSTRLQQSERNRNAARKNIPAVEK